MFVLSSIYEGFGNVVVEAMFAKLPIVITNCQGGAKNIIKNGKYGYIAKNMNIKSLYSQMLKSYKKPKIYNIQNIKKDYSSANISQKYLKIFRI